MLSWAFLRDMGHWALALGGFAAVAGYAITRDPGFLMGVLVGTLLDVATLEIMLRAATHGGRDTSIDGIQRAAGLFALRVIAKAALLVAAFLLPDVLDLAGTAIGVLVVDTTVLVVGSLRALVLGLR